MFNRMLDLKCWKLKRPGIATLVYWASSPIDAAALAVMDDRNAGIETKILDYEPERFEEGDDKTFAEPGTYGCLLDTWEGIEEAGFFIPKARKINDI